MHSSHEHNEPEEVGPHANPPIDFVQLYAYIDNHLNRYELSPQDREDVAQLAWEKYYRALQKRAINHPMAYLRKIIDSAYIDYYRQYLKRSRGLSLEGLQESGYDLADSFTTTSDSMDEHLFYRDKLEALIKSATQLSTAKQRAVLRFLQKVAVNKLDDDTYLAQLFKQYRIDANLLQQPLKGKEQNADATSRYLGLAQLKQILQQLKDADDL